jgi:glycosyltransferase involved in cell wall biosynthesis
MDLQEALGNNFERPVITATDDMKENRKREYARYAWAALNMVGDSVLDIGCSSGFAYRIFSDIKPGINYKGIDYDEKIIDFARSQFGNHFEQGDINTYNAGYRDTIVAFEVIEHVDRGRDIAQELKKHCNQLFLTVPYNETPGLWGEHHRLHGLTQSDFPGFEYAFMNNKGEIKSTPWDELICLMLMYWSKHPKVSVIVTSHNYGEFMEECLQSIEDQTYKNFEILVVDDASTDNTVEIANKFCCNVVLQLAEHVGTTQANIAGIQEAKGQYICFVNADDTIDPMYLERCVLAIESDHTVAIVYTDSHQFGNGKDNDVYFPEYNLPTLQKSNFILGSSLFRREAYFKVGGFDTTLAGMEDYDLWLSICENGWDAKHVPGALYHYRSHANNRTNIMDIAKEFDIIHDKHYKDRKYHVTTEISTKGRYATTLPLTLVAIAMQTRVPDHVIVFEDDVEGVDLRNIPTYNHIIRLLYSKKCSFEVIFGKKRGQHYNHQLAQEIAKDLVWRLDDDVYPEPDVLEKLLAQMGPDVGAVGGTILTNPLGPTPKICSNKIEDVLFAPNHQWFKGTTDHPIDVDHLHCSFLFKRGIAKYNLDLSTVAHTEETQFTYEFRRKGFRVIFVPDAHTWHFRNPEGGIRSEHDPNLWEHDEQIFKAKLKEWGINLADTKFVFLDCGLGDHICFKLILPELQAKHKRIVIACCYPEVFEGEEKVEMMSIAEASCMVGDGMRYNIYAWMIDHNWKTSIVEAYRKMYVG